MCGTAPPFVEADPVEAMASTPMDLDRPERGANGLNIQRTLGGNASVSNLSDVMSTFRPTKVSISNATPRGGYATSR